MKTRFLVTKKSALPIERQPFEIVERKGVGHPDTICDAIAEHVSVELSKAYKREFGQVLHHNIDKCFLVAGQVHLRMGGGAVREPMRLILGDRAAWGIGKKQIPVSDIVVKSAQEWFRSNIPHVNPEKHVRYQTEMRPTSPELESIFEHRGRTLPANDTSAGVGYAPLSSTEQTVLALEAFLNGPQFKQEIPESGEDVKIMAVRNYRTLHLTIAMPFLARVVTSEAHYFSMKANVIKKIQGFMKRNPHSYEEVRILLNALDRKQQGVKGMYLTLLGTSAEQGDSGQVGRGNRVNGVIAFNRPMSGEAAAGKNAVSHVGKIYNVLAHRLAGRIHQEIRGVEEATVWMVSAIGRPVHSPMTVSVEIRLRKGVSLGRVSGSIQDLVNSELGHMHEFCEQLAMGAYRIC